MRARNKRLGLVAIAVALSACGQGQASLPPSAQPSVVAPMQAQGPIGPASAATTSCPGLPAQGAQAGAFAEQVVDAVNAVRAKGANCGGRVFAPTHALEASPSLNCVARSYAQQMADLHFFDHTGPDGSTLESRVDAANIPWRGLAENIAKGQSTPAEVVASCLDSPGHCANLMGDYDLIGNAFVAGVWVQDFVLRPKSLASKCSTPPPFSSAPPLTHTVLRLALLYSVACGPQSPPIDDSAELAEGSTDDFAQISSRAHSCAGHVPLR